MDACYHCEAKPCETLNVPQHEQFGRTHHLTQVTYTCGAVVGKLGNHEPQEVIGCSTDPRDTAVRCPGCEAVGTTVNSDELGCDECDPIPQMYKCWGCSNIVAEENKCSSCNLPTVEPAPCWQCMELHIGNKKCYRCGADNSKSYTKEGRRIR